MTTSFWRRPVTCVFDHHLRLVAQHEGLQLATPFMAFFSHFLFPTLESTQAWSEMQVVALYPRRIAAARRSLVAALDLGPARTTIRNLDVLPFIPLMAEQPMTSSGLVLSNAVTDCVLHAAGVTLSVEG